MDLIDIDSYQMPNDFNGNGMNVFKSLKDEEKDVKFEELNKYLHRELVHVLYGIFSNGNAYLYKSNFDNDINVN